MCLCAGATRVGASLCAVAVGLVGLALAACSPRTALDPVKEQDSALSPKAWQHIEDSLAVVESAFFDTTDTRAIDGMLTVLRMGANPSVKTGAGDAAHSSAGRFSNISLDVTAVRGTHEEVRAHFDAKRMFSMGLRASERWTLGFLRLRRDGFIRNVVLGNLTLRMGERLILGRGFRSYRDITAGGVREGMVAVPSLSRWFGRPGASIAAGYGRWRLQTTVLGPVAATRFHPSMGWLTLARRSRVTAAGLTLGLPIGRSSARGQHAIRLLSLHAAHRAGDFDLSGEHVHYLGGDSFLALRLSQRGVHRWSIRYYVAPLFATASAPSLEPIPDGTVVQGIAADVARRSGAKTTRLAVSLGHRRSASERRLFRRATLSISGRQNGREWECGAFAREEVQTGFSRGPLAVTGPDREEHDLRLRGALRAGGDRVSHVVRLDYAPGREWRSGGLLLAITTRMLVGRLDARLQVSAYSFPSGRRGFISRPGVGAWEWFSIVYGRGSDVAVRIRLSVTEHVSLIGYYGEPWLNEGRVYIGARVRLH